MLTAKNITMAYKANTVLRNISLTCNSGELTVILGPNGTGKTTLLRILSGELMPTSGDVNFGDIPISSKSPEAFARQRAVLSQRSPLPFAMTAEQVVLMGRLPHHTMGPTARDYQIAYESLCDVGAETLIDKPVNRLSGGEQQRVHFARVLAQAGRRTAIKDRLLLLDEPTASMDPSRALHMIRLAKDEAESGATVIAVLHDINLAAAYADRIVLLHRGHLHADGPPASVITAVNIREVFDVVAVVRRHPSLNRPTVVVIDAVHPSQATETEGQSEWPVSQGAQT